MRNFAKLDKLRDNYEYVIIFLIRIGRMDFSLY